MQSTAPLRSGLPSVSAEALRGMQLAALAEDANLELRSSYSSYADSSSGQAYRMTFDAGCVSEPVLTERHPKLLPGIGRLPVAEQYL